jgi:hypothetical protein
LISAGARSIHALTQLLNDTEPDVRTNAAIALAHFAPRTQSAASAMKKMKCGGDPRRNEFQWLKTSLVGN